MKSIFAIFALALVTAPAFASNSTVTVSEPKDMSGRAIIEISGPAADALFDGLSDDLVESSDPESPLGRPVWKTGKNITCIQYIPRKEKTPTSCVISIDKASGKANATQNY